MLIKWHIVLHKKFKVTPVISHVFDGFSPVPGMRCVVSLNLISQGPEQAISGHSKRKIVCTEVKHCSSAKYVAYMSRFPAWRGKMSIHAKPFVWKCVLHGNQTCFHTQGVLPYMGNIGMFRGIGYGFWGSRSLNRVRFFTLLLLCSWCGP